METVEFIIGEIAQPVRLIKVLLVDDDEFIHEMMKLYLANSEYSLSSATNAQDAIKLIDNEPPDILITDAMMPGESGFGLIEKMKARPACADIPVILWTILEDPDGSVMDASGKADILINKLVNRRQRVNHRYNQVSLVGHPSSLSNSVTRALCAITNRPAFPRQAGQLGSVSHLAKLKPLRPVSQIAALSSFPRSVANSNGR
jgi:response regulator RpfG family c-di-GMP phosphodiesterase